MSTLHFLPGVADRLTWFRDSPDAGDPACLCSWCGQQIKEGELPIRAHRASDNTELRMHIQCAQKTIVQFAPAQVRPATDKRPAFSEGQAAFLDAKSRGSNPYRSGANRVAWWEGWDNEWRKAHAKA